jgi:hypothetical protein
VVSVLHGRAIGLVPNTVSAAVSAAEVARRVARAPCAAILSASTACGLLDGAKVAGGSVGDNGHAAGIVAGHARVRRIAPVTSVGSAGIACEIVGSWDWCCGGARRIGRWHWCSGGGRRHVGRRRHVGNGSGRWGSWGNNMFVGASAGLAVNDSLAEGAWGVAAVVVALADL